MFFFSDGRNEIAGKRMSAKPAMPIVTFFKLHIATKGDDPNAPWNITARMMGEIVVNLSPFRVRFRDITTLRQKNKKLTINKLTSDVWIGLESKNVQQRRAVQLWMWSVVLCGTRGTELGWRTAQCRPGACPPSPAVEHGSTPTPPPLLFFLTAALRSHTQQRRRDP